MTYTDEQQAVYDRTYADLRKLGFDDAVSENAARGKAEGFKLPDHPPAAWGPEAEAERQAALDNATASRLARLSRAEYDRVRKAEAKQLGIRESTLDRIVDEVRDDADDVVPDPFPHVEPWTDPVDGEALLTTLAGTVKRFIVCDRYTANIIALWIGFTWCIDAVDVAPICMILSPEKRCGKTQLLALIRKLSCRPIAASSISAAALFRSIEAWHPTLLIDEADAFLRDNEELRGVLNSGHTRDTAFVVRTVGDEHTPTLFSTWGAKAIAGIGKLAETLTDRAIVVNMRRKLSGEHVDRLRDGGDVFDELKSKLARWSEDHAGDVRHARPALPDALNDRARDNWEPLLQVAAAAGGDWPRLGRDAALHLSGERDEAASIGAELLGDMKDAFDQKGVERIFTADLLAALCSDTEAPWATWNRGKEMSARQLAHKLSDYGIVSNTLRIGSSVAKGYERKKCEDAFRRYLPSPPGSTVTPLQAAPDKAFRVTDAEFVTLRENDAVTPNPAPDKTCNGVTDKSGVTAGTTDESEEF